jgi:hypothetical protein
MKRKHGKKGNSEMDNDGYECSALEAKKARKFISKFPGLAGASPAKVWCEMRKRFIFPFVFLERFYDNEGRKFRIQGGVLHDVTVHAFRPAEGQRMIFMCRDGTLCAGSQMVAFIGVQFADIKKRSRRMANRAAVTNCPDLATFFDHWQTHHQVLEPQGLVWLGVAPYQDLGEGTDEAYPEWAPLGLLIIEEDGRHGGSRVLGYAKDANDARFAKYPKSKKSNHWYSPLCITEFDDPMVLRKLEDARVLAWYGKLGWKRVSELEKERSLLEANIAKALNL